MTEETNIAPLDLDFDTTDVDTSRPLLPKGKYRFRVKELTALPNKAGTGKNLLSVFELVYSDRSTKGDPVHAGYQVRKYYPLQPNPKKVEAKATGDEDAQSYDEKGWLKDITILTDACLGIKDPADRPRLNKDTIAMCVGKEVEVSLSIESDSQYGEQNTVNARSIESVE